MKIIQFKNTIKQSDIVDIYRISLPYREYAFFTNLTVIFTMIDE